VLPETVAGPEAILNDTGSPDEAAALALNGLSPKFLLPMVAKEVID
jgi:hypothetical protein